MARSFLNASATDSRSTVAHTSYRPHNLRANGVTFLDIVDLKQKAELQQFLPVCRELHKLLAIDIDSSARISDAHVAILAGLEQSLKTQKDGYQNIHIVEKAIELVPVAMSYIDLDENEWVYFFQANIWSIFDLTRLFPYTKDARWKSYDPAILQLQPDRMELIRPKPHFSFGLEFQDELWRRLREWKHSSVPSVDLFVHPKMAVPFFVFESKSSDGSVRTAENSLANAMIQAHDILCSLSIQSLYVFGMVQCGVTAFPYVSFGTRVIDVDNKSYCHSVYIMRLESCSLLAVNGMLQLLRYIEYVRSYGRGLFRDTVERALLRP